MKIKEWFRNKLIKFLLIDRIQERNSLELKRLNESINSLNRNVCANTGSIKRINEKSEIIENTLRSVVSVGADVVPCRNNERSWAVVCIEGKCNVVKFVNLYGEDYRRILDFLKQYEVSRMCIDAPPSFMFDDVFKF